MKLVKEDVVATIIMFVIFIAIAILGTNKYVMAILPNLPIFIIGCIGAIGVLACFLGIKRYQSIKESVRAKNRYFKFVFYNNIAILLSKDGASWVYTTAMGDINKLKKVEHIELILYNDRKGKPAGYKINPWKYVNEKSCPICEGYGTRKSMPARAMGYTMGFDEDKNILDEQLVPCSCQEKYKEDL